MGELYPNYRPQKSFLNGKEVKYGTKGSSRPDYYIKGSSIEVKNYNVTTDAGRKALINIISKQVQQRVKNLPKKTRQTVVIDVRGQKVTEKLLDDLYKAIVKSCKTDIFIKFLR